MGHDLLEPPENAGLLFGGHADAVVLHIQPGHETIRAEPNGHRLGGPKLERVGHQVLDHLLDRERVQ